MNHNSLVLSTGLDRNTQSNPNNLIQLRISGTAESELKKIAEHVGGDIRSALNNLQIIWPSVEISKLDCSSGISSLTKSLNLNPLHMLSVSQNSNTSNSSETDLNSSQQSSSSLFKTFGIKFDFNKKKTPSLGSKKLGTNYKPQIYVVSSFSSDCIQPLDAIQSSTLKSQHNPSNITKISKNLSLFHALGKVLYSKRSTVLQSLNNSPKNLSNVVSDDRGHLEYDTKNLLQYIPVDLDIFSLYLHQNYPYFTCEVEEHADISDYFSICDLFSNTGANYVSSYTLIQH
ncbi:Cell cycle checkpoint protein RAD17 [Smittium culicis]|uniref:Cell cycle checkpoint protein RAD17 n=1 Tax=Smittium culicis TaxID=133412 RepID=A0A1R1YC59_9FUNG|nr:Cell cycle checkpoint protein RAD17 [Smittium culicis]